MRGLNPGENESAMPDWDERKCPTRREMKIGTRDKDWLKTGATWASCDSQDHWYVKETAHHPMLSQLPNSANFLSEIG